MKIEQQTAEQTVTTEQTRESPFLRVWKTRDADNSAQEIAEYLGCGCNLNLGKL